MTEKEYDITDIFFALIRFSIGSDAEFIHCPTNEEWYILFDIAKRQTLLGVVFAGIERLPKELRPPKELLMQWVVLCDRIKKRNRKMNAVAARVARQFKEDGFDSVLLKGQAVALYYPDPLLRTPGDIDIWVRGSRSSIIRYVRRYASDCSPVYHHVDFNVSDDAEIEVHFTPSWMNSTVTNSILQRFFKGCANESFTNFVTLDESESPISVGTKAFNRVYLMVHIYRHLFSEGVGLRQLLDYYWLSRQGCTDKERETAVHALQRLGMSRFVGAVMYVLNKVFGMQREFMLTAPLAHEGEFLLQEIMLSGNFGSHDQRNGKLNSRNALVRFVSRTVRNWRFVNMYPSEVLWSPVFKMWHAVWRAWYSIFD